LFQSKTPNNVLVHKLLWQLVIFVKNIQLSEEAKGTKEVWRESVGEKEPKLHPVLLVPIFKKEL